MSKFSICQSLDISDLESQIILNYIFKFSHKYPSGANWENSLARENLLLPTTSILVFEIFSE